MGTKICLLCKNDNLFCDYAAAILRSYYLDNELLIVNGSVGDPFDKKNLRNDPDYIISFLSPWIISAAVLESAKIAAINFHPGPPEYPGTGCYNFALYNQAKTYGVTCHYMNPMVDTGAIILCPRFEIAEYETVETLKLKSMNHLLSCFSEILEIIYHNQPLPISNETWSKKPYTKRDLYDLCRIDPFTMDIIEINRRIHAVDYPRARCGAYATINGINYYAQTETRKPLV